MNGLNVNVQVSDSATPFLAELSRALEDRTDLNAAIAARAEQLTRDYVRTVSAPSRHKWSSLLGAKPTGYLAKTADSVESRSDAEKATVTIVGGIYARAMRDVEVIARNCKYLTIPAIAAAYGRRAREFESLRFVVFPSGAKALAKEEFVTVPGKRKKERRVPKLTVYFWLRPSVRLPQDRGLLPSDEAYTAAAEVGARDYLKLT